MPFSPEVSCIVANKVRAASTASNAAKQVSLHSLHCCLLDAAMELEGGVHPRKSWLSAWLAVGSAAQQKKSLGAGAQGSQYKLPLGDCHK